MSYLPATLPPRLALAALVDTHGARATIAALLRVLAARARVRRSARRNALELSDHLRRDIGLPPPAASRWHWELR